MALTDEAIARLRSMILSGELSPGSRLPPEPRLALEMGLSRGGVREAVKVLEAARVLDIRRGDGTYVTSLAPHLLLEGIGFAVELFRDESLAEVMEVRRLLEPAATALAASRITDDELDELADLLAAMRTAVHDAERLMDYDLAFHRSVLTTTGNETLVSLMDGLSGRTLRARLWRSLVGDVAARTIDEHEEIFRALRAREPSLAHAAALLHVNTSDSWLRSVVQQQTEGTNAAVTA